MLNSQERNRLEYLEEQHKERQSHSMGDMEEDFKQTVIDQIGELLDHNYPRDLLNEFADNAVPVHDWDLAQTLANDFSLAESEDIGCVEGVTCIFKIIQCSIYERLLAAGSEALEEYQSEHTDQVNYLIDKWEDHHSNVQRLLSECTSNDTAHIWEKLDQRADRIYQKIDKLESLRDKIENLTN